MHRSEWLHPGADLVDRPGHPGHPYPLRRLDPTCRLRGWRLPGRRDRSLRESTAPGARAGAGRRCWNLPGEMGVYCAGHPQVYSVGLALGDRHSQYDYWHGPLNNPEDFKGRSFLIVGRVDDRLKPAFAEIEPLRWVRHDEDGIGISLWGVTIAHGFRGFPEIGVVDKH